MPTIVINGVTYSGSSVRINNGKISVDGKPVEVEDKIVNISVTGNIASIDADVIETLVVQGDAGSVKTQTGDVEIRGNVSGDVKTQTGDVKCGSIGGSVNTMTGDITHR